MYRTYIGALHGKLRGHVQQRSIFIANGGKIDDKAGPVNNIMRRLSSMYQGEQIQVAAVEEARKKAAILKYNELKLPNMNPQTKRKWNIQQWDKQPFNITNSNTIGLSLSGSKDINNFRTCIQNNVMPLIDSITYNSIFNQYNQTF